MWEKGRSGDERSRDAAPVSSPGPIWEAEALAIPDLRRRAGRYQGDVALCQPRGARQPPGHRRHRASIGRRAHLPGPPHPQALLGRGTPTWDPSGTASRLRTRPAVLKCAPPPPGAGPQQSLADLSSAAQLASSPPERALAVVQATPLLGSAPSLPLSPAPWRPRLPKDLSANPKLVFQAARGREEVSTNEKPPHA